MKRIFKLLPVLALIGLLTVSCGDDNDYKIGSGEVNFKGHSASIGYLLISYDEDDTELSHPKLTLMKEDPTQYVNSSTGDIEKQAPVPYSNIEFYLNTEAGADIEGTYTLKTYAGQIASFDSANYCNIIAQWAENESTGNYYAAKSYNSMNIEGVLEIIKDEDENVYLINFDGTGDYALMQNTDSTDVEYSDQEENISVTFEYTGKATTM